MCIKMIPRPILLVTGYCRVIVVVVVVLTFRVVVVVVIVIITMMMAVNVAFGKSPRVV